MGRLAVAVASILTLAEGLLVAGCRARSKSCSQPADCFANEYCSDAGICQSGKAPGSPDTTIGMDTSDADVDDAPKDTGPESDVDGSPKDTGPESDVDPAAVASVVFVDQPQTDMNGRAKIVRGVPRHLEVEPRDSTGRAVEDAVCRWQVDGQGLVVDPIGVTESEGRRWAALVEGTEKTSKPSDSSKVTVTCGADDNVEATSNPLQVIPFPESVRDHFKSWLTADNVTTDSQNRVKKAQDLSGNSNYFGRRSDSPFGTRTWPTLKTDRLNGHDIMSFDGGRGGAMDSTDSLSYRQSNDEDLALKPASVVAVVKTEDPFGNYLLTGCLTDDYTRIELLPDSVSFFHKVDTVKHASAVDKDLNGSTTDWGVFTASLGGSEATFQWNEEMPAATVSLSDPPAAPFQFDQIGSRCTPETEPMRALEGDLAEFIIINKKLSSDERQSVVRSLQTKYGIDPN